MPRRRSPLLALLGCGVVGVALLPSGGLASAVLYLVVAVAAVAAAAQGLHRHRPERPLGWALVLLGFGGWTAADALWTLESRVWELPGYPVPSDALYLASYVALAAGMLLLVRSRRAGRDVTALLDAAIVTTGVAVLVGVFVLPPIAADSGLSTFGKVVLSAYPLGDLLLLAVLARLWTSPGARTSSYRLLAAALAVTTASDALYNVTAVTSGSTATTVAVDVGWLVGYLLLAAAMRAPSMRTLAEPAPDGELLAPSRTRLAALAGGLVLPAVALLVDGARSGPVHWGVLGVGGLLLSGMVLARMSGLLTVVQAQAVQLGALARSDALTGAPNRRTWDHELSRACAASRAEGRPLSVAMVDLDRFKAYNDAHGHQGGDLLLREAVAAWTAALGDDALLARYGGEEFAVLLPGLTPAEAAARLEALRAVPLLGQTFSAGVAAWDPATDPSSAVADADAALYAAKRTGRDRVVVHVRTAAPHALPQPRVVLQPLVRLADGAVVGHEALARFEEGDPPTVFAQAHAQGLGDLLELAAIQAALAVPGRPPGTALHVNVSARALASPRLWAGLPDDLRDVVVELTESLSVDDSTGLADAVARLRRRGARIALDDVGAGADEFARLSDLRLDVVKVDRSVVSGCHADPGRQAVLRALQCYAQALGAVVCAEGVEDPADLDALRAMGLGHAQGYLLGRPAPQWSVRPALPAAV